MGKVKTPLSLKQHVIDEFGDGSGLNKPVLSVVHGHFDRFIKRIAACRHDFHCLKRLKTMAWLLHFVN